MDMILFKLYEVQWFPVVLPRSFRIRHKTSGKPVSALQWYGASSYRQRYVVGKANQVHHPGRIMERQVRRNIALEQSLLLFMGKVDYKSATQSLIALSTDKWRI
jgi:hypothetical protein